MDQETNDCTAPDIRFAYLYVIVIFVQYLQRSCTISRKERMHENNLRPLERFNTVIDEFVPVSIC